MELTLQDLFGEGASQDEQILKIEKTSLPKLTLKSDNRAEQLLIAVLLQVISNFEGQIVSGSESIVTELEEELYFSNLDFNEFLNAFYWRKTFAAGKMTNQFVFQCYEADLSIA